MNALFRTRTVAQWLLVVMVGSIASLLCQTSSAGTLRDKLIERRTQQSEMEQDDSSALSQNGLPKGTRIIKDVAYGSDAKQKFDVYIPATTPDNASNPSSHDNKAMPVIFMVHGGAWANGGKAMGRVVENKAARWLPKGFIFISTDYRMLPTLQAREQAEDVALALAVAQSKAKEWGGDPSQFIVMGHSAGAHLVALLAASPDVTLQFGVRPWLGTIALDSAAYDLSAIMSTKHYGFYDKAFGKDPGYWRASSPLHKLEVPGVPFLAVCSSKRPDRPCDQASSFVQKANGMGMRASLLPQAKSHGEINFQLGLDGDYTTAVEKFMASLSPVVQAHLRGAE